jgi:hypothetical protein
MIISDKKEVIFVHIPRTGGTIVSKKICESIGVKKWRQFIGEPREVAKGEGKLNYKRRAKIAKHAKPKKIKRAVGKEKWKSYFKFTFVRNPWSRTVSTYLKAIKEAPNTLKKVLPIKTMFRVLIRAKYDIMKMGTTQQVEWVYNKEEKKYLDFIGKYENIESDFELICNKINIKANLDEEFDATKNVNYKHFYDNRTKNIVAEVNSKDVKKFGYDF